jgi:dTDP-4-amino-4,6-dideoxygalactose transaminase
MLKKKIYLMRPSLGSNEINAIKQVFKSKFLTEGQITEKFEDSVSKYVKSKFAIATTSATTALHSVFESINIKGKKVLVSDFTFPASINAIILAGGIPVLADVNRETMNITRSIVEETNLKNIEVIEPVSIFGNPLEKEFYNLKKKMFIVEDAATSLGTKLGTSFVGSLANVSCFSFHPRKIITTGEGGMITTNDKVLTEKIRSFKAFGKKENKFVGIGTNYKISDIQSAIGVTQLKKIEIIIKNRQSMAKIYSEIIEKMDHIEIQKPTKNARITHQSFVCIITKPNIRNTIISKLVEKRVETQIGTYALHCLPAFKKCLKHGKLKNSEFLYKNSLSLPMHEEITVDDQEYVCKSIEKIIKNS